jgi:hypothetical protein
MNKMDSYKIQKMLKPPSFATLALHYVRCSAGEHPGGTAAGTPQRAFFKIQKPRQDDPNGADY